MSSSAALLLPPSPSSHIEPDPLLTNDSGLMLREARRRKGLTQRMVASLSGVGEKTISSFETGSRIERMKVSQLRKLLKVYGLTPAQFFSGDINAVDALVPSSAAGPHAPEYYAQFIASVIVDAEHDGLTPGCVIDAVVELRRRREAR